MENETDTDMEKLEKLILKREKRKEYLRNHYEKNKEKIIESSKKYYKEKIKPRLLEEQQFIKDMQTNIALQKNIT